MGFESFDIIQFLEDRDVPFKTSGKNTSQGWISLQCFFCDDASNHLGVNLEKKNFNCWKCGQTGDALRLVMEVDQCSLGAARKTVEEFQEDPFAESPEPTKPDLSFSKYILPEEASDDFPERHVSFLKSRRYDPETVISKYKLKACYNVGKFCWRVIIPFFLNNRLVTFTSVSVYPEADPQYIHCPRGRGELSIKDTLYNIDLAKDRVILVEGIFDSWRVGDGAVAIMGKTATEAQVRLLRSKEFQSIAIMLDSDAREQNERLADTISAFIPNVILINLKKGDPDDLDQESINYLRRNLL